MCGGTAMHTAFQLSEDHFALSHRGVPTLRAQLFPDWGLLDRLGIIVHEPFGAVGASHLIQLAITSFYDARPARRDGIADGMDPRSTYPEIYLFHVGGAHGDHSGYDFWPGRKEVLLPRDARLVLEAINERAITWLVAPDHPGVPVEHAHAEASAAHDRIRGAFAYSATGRVASADWELAGTAACTEENPRTVLSPEARASSASRIRRPDDPDLARRSWPVRTDARLNEAADGLTQAQRRREALKDAAGLVTETYRGVSIAEALAMLV